MEALSTNLNVRQIGPLLRGEPELLQDSMARWSPARTLFYVTVIIAGTGVYGAAMGCWRDPLQAACVAVKFPLIILLTALGNGLLNGMLAPLLGMNLSFRQSLHAVLMSFTIAAVILGSFSPLILFLVWNAPPMSQHSFGAYGCIQLTHVAVIAFAGMASNLRLAQLLRLLSGNELISRRVLLAWLTGNFILGSQLSWILRPFIGSPGLPVQFLRADAFAGNFFEAVFYTVRHLLSL